MTPSSSATRYCSGTIAVQYVDARYVGHLLSDDDNAVANADVPTHANFLAALDAASGEVEAAALAGGRYLAADLAALTGMGAALLQRLVAMLAVAGLELRRTPTQPVSELAKAADKFLERLRTGERVFAFAEVQEAAEVERIDDSDLDVVRPLISSVASRYFGSRQRYVAWP